MEHRKTTIIMLSVGAGLTVVHWLIWGRFLPNQAGFLGEDYRVFLPYLLNGFYWFKTNGLFEVPWFSPAFCSGLPFYSNPESIYYSVPQLLTLLVDPLTSVQVTFVSFAAIGYIGTYLLMHKGFDIDPGSAMLAATVFMFNGVYEARLIAGHMPWHSITLTPLIAYFLVKACSGGKDARRYVLGITLSALGFTYIFQAGNIHAILPMAMAVIAIGAIYGLRGGNFPAFLAAFALSAVGAAILSSAKLVSAFAFLSTTPREGYPLPGSDNLLTLIGVILHSLFLDPAVDLANETFVNQRFNFGAHELDISVTWVPALILLVFMGFQVAKWARGGLPSVTVRTAAIFGIIALILIIPLVVNVYTPEWNAILKRIPIIKNSSSLTRWFIVYVPLVAVATAFSVNRISQDKVKTVAVVLGILAVVAVNFEADQSEGRDLQYPPAEVVAGYRNAVENRTVPPISYIQVYLNQRGQAIRPVFANNLFVKRGSPLHCYAAIFGYVLEWLPSGKLRPGAVLRETQGKLNLFDPACFVYPKENRCQPGDLFSADRRKDAEKFIRYRPYAYSSSAIQRIANALNLAGLAGVLGVLVFLGVAKTITMLRNRGHGIPDDGDRPMSGHLGD